MLDHEPNLQLMEFYVYQLRDGDSVFYIGKGQGRRAEDHCADARRVLTSIKHGAISFDECSDKQRLLLRMFEEGREPAVEVIARFASEAEAHAVESVMIKWVHGLNNLTNEIRGHSHESVRPCGHQGNVPGLDVERRAGDYAAANRIDLEHNGAYAFLDAINNALQSEGFPVFEPTPDRNAGGPANGYLATCTEIAGIPLIVEWRKSCIPKVSVVLRGGNPALDEPPWADKLAPHYRGDYRRFADLLHNGMRFANDDRKGRVSRLVSALHELRIAVEPDKQTPD